MLHIFVYVFSSCFLKFLAISLDFQLKKHEEILTVHEHECTEECGFCDMDGDEQGIYSRVCQFQHIFIFPGVFLEIHLCPKFPLIFFFFSSTLFAVCKRINSVMFWLHQAQAIRGHKTVRYDDGPKEKDYFHSGVSLHFRPVVVRYGFSSHRYLY